MRKHTDYGSISEMIEHSGFEVDNAEWDEFVSKRSRFSNWEEMQGAAAEQYVAKKLGF